IASNGSGDYVIALSVAEENLIPYSPKSSIYRPLLLTNEAISPVFLATIEATEEAIINALFAAQTLQGQKDRVISELPVDRVLKLMNK
ncbi:MAG: P1 family peptidase, partial [Flavobacteriaceae bacterium]